MRLRFSLLSSLSLLSGCAFIGPQVNDPTFAPIIPEFKTDTQQTAGSLYNEIGGLSLYTDTKAHRLGDIITVVLQEKTQAKKDASNKFDKKSENTHVNPTIFSTGPKFDLPKDVPLKEHKGLSLGTSVDFKSKFDGSGSATQNNELTGNITVTVIQILPNQHLVIKGEKWITLNQGSEFIRLTGVVRPEDITSTNTIESHRIANARITYSGRGSLAESNKAGWMTKFFSHSWFPF